MPRLLCIAFACLLILASPALAETDGEVYETVDSIIAEAEEGVREDLATFVQANERPLGKARGELAELIARLNKDGRSQLATSIQKRVNTLEETVQKRASAKVPIVEPPKKPLLERLEGKWERRGFARRYRFYQNGNAECCDPQETKVINRGRITLPSPDSAEIVWDNDWREHFTLAGDDLIAVLSWTPQGTQHEDGFVLERIK